MSRELVMEYSISPTSPLILAIMSPFLSWEKKPSGRLRSLLYTFVLISLTIPVLRGTIIADEPK